MPPVEHTPEYWLHPNVALFASPIAGSGLRSRLRISENEIAVRFTDPPTSVGALRHLNHSCDPTLWWTDDSTLVARRMIASGDELTVDYATSSADPDFTMYCHCETYRCRQLIADVTGAAVSDGFIHSCLARAAYTARCWAAVSSLVPSNTSVAAAISLTSKRR